MYDKTLHERLTDLLMDKGCTVNKLAIDELIKFIALRDEEILNKMIKDSESLLAKLQRETALRHD